MQAWQFWCGDPSRRTFTSIVSNTPRVPTRAGSIRILTCRFTLCHRRLRVERQELVSLLASFRACAWVCGGLGWACRRMRGMQ